MRTPDRRRLDLIQRIVYISGLGLLLGLVLVPSAAARERSPAVAGQFYPGDPVQLRAAIQAYLADALPPQGERPIVLVAPHAGYIFSGQIAADAYGQAIDHDYDLIVILGTNHTTGGFSKVSVYDGTGYRTPLGLAEIDGEVVSQLLVSSPDITFAPSLHTREHSVEVQVPFAQVAFPDVPIVTAVIGTPDLSLCRRFGEVLAKVLAGRQALIVASSDLSHYPVYDDAVRADLATLAGIASLDPNVLKRKIDQQMRSGTPALLTCACGEAPVLAAMVAAMKLGAQGAQVVSYANSGDTLVGDRGRVVGYGAVTLSAAAATDGTLPIWRSPAEGLPGPVSDDDRKLLLEFARDTMRQYLKSNTTPLPRLPAGPAWQQQGAFVTLEKGGELRGCMGYRETNLPLVRVIGSMALAAAVNDRRFKPVSPEELESIEIRISLLGPSKRVSSVRTVRLGQDGVLLEKGGHEALFLPEVAEQFDFNAEVFFERLCLKAGLNASCWQQGAKLHTFQTDSFAESDLGLTGP